MKSLIVLILCVFLFNKSHSQNAMLNILTQHNGIVKQGEKLLLEVSLTNTNHSEHIGIYKLKIQISIPKEIVSIDTVGHILPTGWKIISNNGLSILLSNSMDMIAAKDNRNLFIALKGNNIGGPLTINGQLSFSDGIAPGTAPGVLKNDLPGDNNSTTTCKVIN